MVRSFAPDLIRSIAICGVLFIHLTYPIYARPDFLGGATWWLAQSINSIFRISIPLFIMLSGYLLLHKNENIQKTVARTLLRLALPLVGWSIIYALWDHFWFNNSFSIASLLTGLLSGGANHLYFLGILINLYLLLPILRVFWQYSSLGWKQYVVVLSITFGWMHTALGYFVFEQQLLMPTIFTIGLPYLGYFLVGGYVRDMQFSGRQLLWVSITWLLATASTAFLGFFALELFAKGNSLFAGTVPYFDNYLSPNVSIAAISAFIALLSLQNQNKLFLQQSSMYAILYKSASVLASVAFGLYILHPMVMNILDFYFSFQVDFMEYSLLSYLIVRSVLVFLFTVVATFTLIKLPLIRKLLGE